MSYLIPDLNAPRFRKADLKFLDTRVTAKEYLKANPKSTLTVEQILEIWGETHKEIKEIAKTEKNGFEIPGIGVLRHFSVKNVSHQLVLKEGLVKERMIDHGMSRKLGKIVRFHNFDTDGRMLKIALDYKLIKYKITNREGWVFTAERKYKRESSKSFRSNFHRLIQL